MAQTQSLVALSNAGIQREGRWLARNIDFSISAGEILTLIGPNGSGKSTSAKMMLGILKPDEGKVERRPKLRVGYVPQKVMIDWSMPLNVERFMQLTQKLNTEEMDRALERAGISHLKKNQVRDLSGGEFQRAMLARAITRKPDLLVLDEPVQGVDFSGQIALYELIGNIRDELGCGILMVSHDLHVVMAQTDRVICLNGHVCCQGTPRAVIEDPAYKNLFGGRAAETLAVYHHDHDHTHLPDGRVRHADGSITDTCHPDDGHHDHNHASKSDA